MRDIFKPFREADKSILAIIAALGIFSLTMLESTAYDGAFVMARCVLIQLISYLIGFAIIVIIQHVDYRFLLGAEKFLYVCGILLLVSVYIPGLGVELYGSRAWINLGFTTLQPSEFVKIIFVMVNASYLVDHQNELDKFWGVCKSALYAAPMIIIVLKEDLGSALVYMVMWVLMIFFAGIDYKVLFRSILLTLLAIPVAYKFLAEYQKARIEAFLHPDNLGLPGNYNVWQSKVAIGSGGVFGKGLFKGTQKSLDFIPVQQSDFIFSVVGEELGLIGGLALITLYSLLFIRLTKIIRDCEDLYGALITIGFTGMFLFQVFENIAMTMGLMPATGITLPFMSGGGTSVIASMIAIGILLNIGVNSKSINF